MDVCWTDDSKIYTCSAPPPQLPDGLCSSVLSPTPTPTPTPPPNNDWIAAVIVVFVVVGLHCVSVIVSTETRKIWLEARLFKLEVTGCWIQVKVANYRFTIWYVSFHMRVRAFYIALYSAVCLRVCGRRGDVTDDPTLGKERGTELPQDGTEKKASVASSDPLESLLTPKPSPSKPGDCAAAPDDEDDKKNNIRIQEGAGDTGATGNASEETKI